MHINRMRFPALFQVREQNDATWQCMPSPLPFGVPPARRAAAPLGLAMSRYSALIAAQADPGCGADRTRIMGILSVNPLRGGATEGAALGAGTAASSLRRHRPLVALAAGATGQTGDLRKPPRCCRSS